MVDRIEWFRKLFADVDHFRGFRLTHDDIFALIYLTGELLEKVDRASPSPAEPVSPTPAQGAAEPIGYVALLKTGGPDYPETMPIDAQRTRLWRTNDGSLFPVYAAPPSPDARVKELERQARELSGRLVDVSNERDESNARNKTLRAMNDKQGLHIAGMQSDLDAAIGLCANTLQEDLSDSTAEQAVALLIENYEGRIKSVEQTAESRRERAKQAEQERDVAKAERDLEHGNVLQLISERDAAVRDLAERTAERDDAWRTIDAAKAERAELEARLAERTAERDAAVKARDEWCKQFNMKSEEHADLMARCAELSRERDGAREACNVIVTNLHSALDKAGAPRERSGVPMTPEWRIGQLQQFRDFMADITGTVNEWDHGSEPGSLHDIVEHTKQIMEQKRRDLDTMPSERERFERDLSSAQSRLSACEQVVEWVRQHEAGLRNYGFDKLCDLLPAITPVEGEKIDWRNPTPALDACRAGKCAHDETCREVADHGGDVECLGFKSKQPPPAKGCGTCNGSGSVSAPYETDAEDCPDCDPTPAAKPAEQHGEWLTVIVREGTPEVLEWDDYLDAVGYWDEAGAQWSEAWVCRKVRPADTSLNAAQRRRCEAKATAKPAAVVSDSGLAVKQGRASEAAVSADRNKPAAEPGLNSLGRSLHHKWSHGRTWEGPAAEPGVIMPYTSEQLGLVQRVVEAAEAFVEHPDLHPDSQRWTDLVYAVRAHKAGGKGGVK